jgi:transcriptional regulator with XRE-family HTH domain
MVDRIKEIILKEGLTSGSFADLVGVQRSSMSHILNGRNNPSLDFIVKTLHHFPKINPEWLLTGMGSYNRSETPAKPLATAIQPSIFDSIPEPVAKPIPAIEVKPIEKQIDTIKIPEKYVDKVLIFYSDHTYDEFSKTQKPQI